MCCLFALAYGVLRKVKTVGKVLEPVLQLCLQHREFRPWQPICLGLVKSSHKSGEILEQLDEHKTGALPQDSPTQADKSDEVAMDVASLNLAFHAMLRWIEGQKSAGMEGFYNARFLELKFAVVARQLDFEIIFIQKSQLVDTVSNPRVHDVNAPHQPSA